MVRRLRVPSYRLHKTHGLAHVVLGGKRHYLGPYDSPESKELYDRMVRTWLAKEKQPSPGERLVLVELMAKYLDHLTVARRAMR